MYKCYIHILYIILDRYYFSILYHLPHMEEHVAGTEIRTKLFIIVILQVPAF
jgi:hypothetical protein